MYGLHQKKHFLYPAEAAEYFIVCKIHSKNNVHTSIGYHNSHFSDTVFLLRDCLLLPALRKAIEQYLFDVTEICKFIPVVEKILQSRLNEWRHFNTRA